MRPGLLGQVGPLARRSIKRTVRQPPLIVLGLVFPLFLYGFNVGGLDLATSLPGFPTDSYATFALALTFAFAGVTAVLVAGIQLGDDIRTGFIKRQSLTPLRGSVLLLGHLAGVVFIAICQAIIFLLVGLAAGASVEAGPGGALLIIGFAVLYALAMGSVGLLMALVTRSGEAVLGLFPLMMALLFLSSVNLPRELIKSGWFQDVTTFNPVSYLVEAPRSLLVEGWEAQPLLLGAAVAAAILLGALTQAATSLRALAVAR